MHISRSLNGSLRERGERELQADPAGIARQHIDFPCEGVLRDTLFFLLALFPEFWFHVVEWRHRALFGVCWVDVQHAATRHT